MPKAIKSDKPLNAKINKNFVVKVKEPTDKDWKITSANKLSIFVNDEELKIRLFNKVLPTANKLLPFQYEIGLKSNFTQNNL